MSLQINFQKDELNKIILLCKPVIDEKERAQAENSYDIWSDENYIILKRISNRANKMLEDRCKDDEK